MEVQRSPLRHCAIVKKLFAAWSNCDTQLGQLVIVFSAVRKGAAAQSVDMDQNLGPPMR